MADTFQLPESVTSARQNAADLTSVANKYSAAEPSVSDVLRQRVQEAYSNNQDVIKPLDTATANYYSAPATAREKYLTPGSANYVQNPFSAERLVSQYTNNAAVPMLSYGSILGQRMGRIEDLIGTGVNAWTAGKNAALAQAQEARQLYEDNLNEYLQMQDLNLRQQQIDKAGSGSGAPFSLADLIALLNLNDQQNNRKPITDAIEEEEAAVPESTFEAPPVYSVPLTEDKRNSLPQGALPGFNLSSGGMGGGLYSNVLGGGLNSTINLNAGIRK